MIWADSYLANGEDSLYLPTSPCQRSLWTPPNLSQKLFSFSLLVAQYFIGKKTTEMKCHTFCSTKKGEKIGRHTYSLFTVIKKYEISYYIRTINTHSFVLTIFLMWILPDFCENHNCQIPKVNFGIFNKYLQKKKKKSLISALNLIKVNWTKFRQIIYVMQ